MEADFVEFAVDNLTRSTKADDSNELYEEVRMHRINTPLCSLYNYFLFSYYLWGISLLLPKVTFHFKYQTMFLE